MWVLTVVLYVRECVLCRLIARFALCVGYAYVLISLSHVSGCASVFVLLPQFAPAPCYIHMFLYVYVRAIDMPRLVYVIRYFSVYAFVFVVGTVFGSFCVGMCLFRVLCLSGNLTVRAFHVPLTVVPRAFSMIHSVACSPCLCPLPMCLVRWPRCCRSVPLPLHYPSDWPVALACCRFLVVVCHCIGVFGSYIVFVSVSLFIVLFLYVNFEYGHGFVVMCLCVLIVICICRVIIICLYVSVYCMCRSVPRYMYRFVSLYLFVACTVSVSLRFVLHSYIHLSA
jgi:hypothetical protein